MTLGFKDRFLPYVEEGSKRHTVRAGERWHAGMRADLYAKVRQKGQRLLFRDTVTKVEPITIRKVTYKSKGCENPTLFVEISAHVLSPDETEAFFFHDGFRDKGNTSIEQAMKHWEKQLKRDVIFRGQIIHWTYDTRWDLNGQVSIDQLAAAISRIGFFPDRNAIVGIPYPERRRIEQYCLKVHKSVDNPRVRVPAKPNGLNTATKLCDGCGSPSMTGCACG